VPPDKPSPESHKITESLVLLDFVADLSNELLPPNPVLRAKARFFINAVSTGFVPAYHSFVLSGEPVSSSKLLASLESLQALLPSEGFAVGGPEFTIADASVAPFLARMEVLLKNDVGAYDEGAGHAAWGTFQTDDKYARIRKYFDDIKGRKSFKTTFDEVSSFVSDGILSSSLMFTFF
jgi:glutathione S-transferase